MKLKIYVYVKTFFYHYNYIGYALKKHINKRVKIQLTSARMATIIYGKLAGIWKEAVRATAYFRGGALMNKRHRKYGKS